MACWRTVCGKVTLPLLCAAMLACVMARPASAYVFLMKATTGANYTWAPPYRPQYAVNPDSYDLSYDQLYTAFTNSLSRWKYSGGTVVDFTYSQSADNPTEMAFDGINAVFFSSNSTTKLGGGVLGATSTAYLGNNIVEFDVEFNDDDFVFSANASDSTLTTGKVFLENVATHEFGHSLGLNHSGVLQTTMMWTEAPGQAKLSCDDVLGIAAAYPAAGFSAARGSITGTIQTGADAIAPGAAVFGGHVVAVSKTRGTVIEGQATLADGSFTLRGLEPGGYYLAIEPFMANDVTNSLCQGGACYFATANSSSVCAGSNPFKRSIVEAAPGVARKVVVSAGGTTNVGTLSTSCSSMSHPAAWATATALNGDTPSIISNANSGEAAVRGVISGILNTSHYYKLQNVSGDLAAKVVAFGLYAPWNPTVQIVDGSGAVVAGSTSTANVFQNASSYTNYDATAALASAPAGDYYVKVTNSGSPTIQAYPGGSASQIDSSNFYVLIVTINDLTGLLPSNAAPLLANNARCEATDGFPAVANSGRAIASQPAGSSGGTTTTTETTTGGCGTLRDAGGDDYDGNPPGASAFLSFAGISVMLLMARLLQQLARRYIAR